MNPDYQPHYRIALAGKAHLAAIPAIQQAAAGLFSFRDLPENIRYRVTERDVLAQAWREQRLWVGLDTTEAVAGFALADTMDGDAFLDEVDVKPSHGRRGLGTRLVRTVTDWAAARNYPALMLLTFRHLPWNAPFYASLGFTALRDDELSAGVRERLRDEKSAGIDIRNRVAMRLLLG
jgi:GNAT superfamily N-acetyltransferase